MTVGVLVAVGGPWEAPLVAGLGAGEADVAVVRRCADLAELLATAGAGLGGAAVVSDDLRGLDAAAVDRLAAAGVAVVGLAGPGRPDAEERLAALGVDRVLPADTAAAEVAGAVLAAVAAAAGRSPLQRRGARTAVADPAAVLDRLLEAVPREDAPPRAAESPPPEEPDADEPGRRSRGRVLAVWGAPGAPGRTTTATSLAGELAVLLHGRGEDVVLVDADVHAAAVAQVLGVLDESPGLAAAVRAAGQGRLDLPALARLAVVVSPGLRVLTGLPRASRWPELRPSGVEAVLERARELAAWTVVDLAAPVELDEEVAFDVAAPRRNGVTLAVLESADEVLAVGTADPVGLQRLVRSLQELAEVLPEVRPRVVVTRVRASAVGRRPEQRVREALERYAGVADPVLVPEDREALDGALLAGRSLAEHAPGSPARQALAALARVLTGEPEPAAGRARRGRRVLRPA